MEPNLSFLDKLLIITLSGLIIWVLTNIIVLILKIVKLKNSILVDINLKIDELSECKDFIIKYFD